MTPYILVALLILIFNLLFFKKTKYYSLGYLFLFVVLFLLAILRDISVGTDYETYQTLFLEIGEQTYLESLLAGIFETKELGWYFINKIFYFIGNYYIYILFFYFISYLLIFKTMWQESAIPYLSVMLFFFCGYYFSSYNIMRQFLIFSVFVYSTRYIYERRFWRYMIVIILCSFFHSLALLLIPLYFINELRLTKQIWLIFLIVSLVVGYFNLALYLGDNFELLNRFEMYLSLFRSEISLAGYLIYAVNTIIGFLFLIYMKDINSEKAIYVKIALVGIVLSNIFMHYEWIGRFPESTLMPLLIIGFPNVISELRLQSNRLILFICLIVYGCTLFYSSLSNNLNGILPYKLII